MNDVWLRAALVAGALVIAGLIALISRRRANARVHTVLGTNLDPGIYFFSSATCATCEQARAILDSQLGPKGYEELAWENHPEVFTEHRVEKVPAVMIVDDAGRGRIRFGVPDGAWVLE